MRHLLLVIAESISLIAQVGVSIFKSTCLSTFEERVVVTAEGRRALVDRRADVKIGLIEPPAKSAT
jgi:hypothetical protein